MLPEVVQAKIDALPSGPGCYLFRDAKGGVLYVGKAKSLRSRVRSYFQDSSSDTRAFLPLLRRHLADLETFVTATEKEAAILENSLIKESKPRFNVKLRDDKEYLTLRLSAEHEYPRLELVRRPSADRARYFGPYHSATAARRTAHLVEKHFQLRTCSDRELGSRSRPCIQFQIKRCLAPCVYEIDRAEYAEQVRRVALFLAGRHDELKHELELRMQDASRELEFERAGAYRDQLRAVQIVHEQQRVEIVSDGDQDVLGLYRQGDLVELTVVYVRSGRVVDIVSFSHKRLDLPDDEVVAAFLREHYGAGGPGAALIPDQVLVPVLPEGVDGVSEWLSDLRREAAQQAGERARKAEIIAPARGPKKKLLELAFDNAQHAFEEKRRTAEDMDERLARLQARLRLPALPRRIECVDISHLGGDDTVGGVVALKDGLPDKSRYRTYKLRGVKDGDDYAAIYEVLSRRFRRGRDADATPTEGTPAEVVDTSAAEWSLPDLLVVDGGRGQLGVALTAAHDLGLFELPIVGLAKERETVTGTELVDRVYLPGQKNPIPLRPSSPELFLLARARDEAHRFSNRGRKQVGKARRLASSLDDIPGIGKKTRVALLTSFESLAALYAATDEQLLAVKRVTKRQVAALRAFVAAKATEPEA